MPTEKPSTPSTAAMISTLVEDKFAAYLENYRSENNNPMLGPRLNDRTVKKLRSYDAEIELPLPAQVKILRALQESEIRPVGGSKTKKVDVRVRSRKPSMVRA
jgi:DNA-binding NtrC family response regulator